MSQVSPPVSPPVVLLPARPRVRLLVSVRDAAEARWALRAGADLIDAKDPERGALGALAPDTVRAIVATVAGQAVTSAVAGDGTGADLPQAVAAMAAVGPDWIKVAVGPAPDDAALAEAAAAAPGRLIGVLFAEDGSSGGDLPARLATAGFSGAMIDTRGKQGVGLRACLALPLLSAFVAACRSHGLMSGLAGSLHRADIPTLAPLQPDYLGFRGGLCHGGDRRQPLDEARIAGAVAALRAQARADAA
ncbi:(5-formylfuran-3-yl)methyl phosphate synthase [Methylobacterium sp. Leaf118]|uniref:(5-formylfuran-3-yl)methyl phosphate synthase n=1 Tax=Methylobacterium sp. Leaf118 TaxID=2876562 RepID=UPI001E4B6C94|nr:(5-formylfuran-3-yl)methyl phosphate synthase [Methylobacterium sp. Leaf118]